VDALQTRDSSSRLRFELLAIKLRAVGCSVRIVQQLGDYSEIRIFNVIGSGLLVRKKFSDQIVFATITVAFDLVDEFHINASNERVVRFPLRDGFRFRGGCWENCIRAGARMQFN
jgi:hypothetical protein